MWTRIRNLSIFCIGCCIPLAINAQPNPYVRITAGKSFAVLGRDQNVFVDSYYWDRFIANRHLSKQVYGGFSAGERIPLTPSKALEFGIGYYQDKFAQDGRVYQLGELDFYNLDYHYMIHSQALMIEGKLLTTLESIYHPYIYAGIGGTHNTAHHYEEVPLHNYAVPLDPAFQSYSQDRLAYSVGFGFDVDVTERLRFGAGYNYTNLNKAKLGVISQQSLTQTAISHQIRSGTIIANHVQIQLTYTI